MKEIRRFVKRLFKDQKLPVDEKAEDKLVEMLTEKVEDLKEGGLEEGDAIHRAIVEFGELDKDYQPLLLKERKRFKRHKTLSHYANDLFFSLIASALIIAILVFVHFLYLPWRHWYVIPSLGILFWPLVLLYRLLNKKKD